ncbi:hypothetical protein AGMMS49938_14110 [Fibrobacterales bacterium]|nr:hypothetical protein AGMMS49938_14110 [Fibrobacterales bacterium]
MKKVLIDINVILDFLNKRNFHEVAAQVIVLCVEKKLDGYVCAHEITTLSYFLEKTYRNNKNINAMIVAVLDSFTVIPIDEMILRTALRSAITDFEDAVIEVKFFAIWT